MPQLDDDRRRLIGRNTAAATNGAKTMDIAAGSVGDVSQFAKIADVCGSTDKP